MSEAAAATPPTPASTPTATPTAAVFTRARLEGDGSFAFVPVETADAMPLFSKDEMVASEAPEYAALAQSMLPALLPAHLPAVNDELLLARKREMQKKAAEAATTTSPYFEPQSKKKQKTAAAAGGGGE